MKNVVTLLDGHVYLGSLVQCRFSGVEFGLEFSRQIDKGSALSAITDETLDGIRYTGETARAPPLQGNRRYR